MPMSARSGKVGEERAFQMQGTADGRTLRGECAWHLQGPGRSPAGWSIISKKESGECVGEVIRDHVLAGPRTGKE